MFEVISFQTYNFFGQDKSHSLEYRGEEDEESSQDAPEDTLPSNRIPRMRTVVRRETVAHTAENNVSLRRHNANAK